MSESNRPEKIQCDKLLLSSQKHNLLDCPYCMFNRGIEMMEEYLAEKEPELKPLDVYELTHIIADCKRKGKDAGYTALEIYETFGQPKDNGLKPMDEENAYRLCAEKLNPDWASSLIILKVIKIICQTFGQPKASVPSIDERIPTEQEIESMVSDLKLKPTDFVHDKGLSIDAERRLIRSLKSLITRKMKGEGK